MKTGENKAKHAFIKNESPKLIFWIKGVRTVPRARKTGVGLRSRMNEVSQGSRDFGFQKYNFWLGMIN